MILCKKLWQRACQSKQTILAGHILAQVIIFLLGAILDVLLSSLTSRYKKIPVIHSYTIKYMHVSKICNAWVLGVDSIGH